MNRCLSALCLLLLLGACSPNDNQSPAPKMLEEQRSVLDKAKALDSEMQKADETQRKAVEQQAR
ncbi:MAG TPA: hypothetical protein VK149_00620 [Sideroxyarcus sp.]|nr:hypothetical protein [Sideroxyarcus sp.]